MDVDERTFIEDAKNFLGVVTDLMESKREPRTRRFDSGMVVDKYTIDGAEYYVVSLNGNQMFSIKQGDLKWVARDNEGNTVASSRYRHDVFDDLNRLIKEFED